MNKLRSIIAAAILAPLAILAGPEPTPAPTPIDPQKELTQVFEGAAKYGNFSLAVSPGYAPKLGNGAWGLAIVGGYQINEFLGAYVRGDIFDGNYYVASGSVTAQYPIHFSKFTIRPFAEAGVGSKLGGPEGNNNEVFAIAGGGIAGDLWKSKDGNQSLSVLGVVETWQPVYSGVSIYRVGLSYGIKF